MTQHYLVRPSADRDIDDIANNLADRAGIDIGLRFIDSVYATLELISRQPAMGWASRSPRLRLRKVRTFRVEKPFEKYLIYYEQGPEAIEIMRVLHGGRDLESLLH